MSDISADGRALEGLLVGLDTQMAASLYHLHGAGSLGLAGLPKYGSLLGASTVEKVVPAAGVGMPAMSSAIDARHRAGLGRS